MNGRNLVCVFLAVQIFVLVTTAALSGIIPGISVRNAKAGSVQHFSLLAETMHPVDSTIGYDNDSAFLMTTQNSTIHDTNYVGQLNLPDGATIVSALCFGRDTDPSNEFSFKLYRYRLGDYPVYTPLSVSAGSGISFNGGNVIPESIIDPAYAVINNTEYSYSIFLTLPVASSGQLGVLNCIIGTSYNISLPIVKRD